MVEFTTDNCSVRIQEGLNYECITILKGLEEKQIQFLQWIISRGFAEPDEYVNQPNLGSLLIYGLWTCSSH